MNRISNDSINKREAKRKINVLIVDDHQLVRQTIRKRIDNEDDMKVLGEAADGKEAIKLTKEVSPDVILMDINMPIMDGIEATRKILAFSKQIRIIGFSMNNQTDISDSMLKAGAVAYTTKDIDFNSLCDVIRKAVKNHR